MPRARSLSGSILLVCLLAPASGRAALLSIHRSARGAAVVVNEVQYDPPPSGRELQYEWVELYNAGGETVELAGWSLADNRTEDAIPAAVLGPGGFLVIAGGAGFLELYPDYTGRLVIVEGGIGNGLGNDGDQVRLLDARGSLVDAMSYGDDVAILDPSAPSVAAAHSLERVPVGIDTDTAGDWLDQPEPSPGRPCTDARPTSVGSSTPPNTPSVSELVLNEYMPAPREVDWDGDGIADSKDEWVELFNPDGVNLVLCGWQLDDEAGGGSKPHSFDENAVVPARGYLVVFRRESGITLNNTGDSLRLLGPNGEVVDATEYKSAHPDVSFSRSVDGVGAWTDTLEPSPGRSNGESPGPTRPGPTVTAPPGGSATPTIRPGGSPTATGAPPPPAGPVFLPILITEVMFDPVEPGTDAAYEWVEVFNRSDQPVQLTDWEIGDAASWDLMPDVFVAARSFLVIAATEKGANRIDLMGTASVAVLDGRIGNGLANGGDVVRIRGPTGELVDAVSFGSSLAAFDPSVPVGPPGTSIERLPADIDTDTADDWWIQPAPSPGIQGELHRDPPRVVINEVLPSPSRVDWGGDGSADHTDEWVELHNSTPYTVSLAGWRLAKVAPVEWWYEFTSGTSIEGEDYYVVHAAQSGLSLPNSGGTIALIRDDGVEADRFTWTASPGYDRSWGRWPDARGEWTRRLDVTPGEPNRPRQTADSDEDPSPAGEPNDGAREEKSGAGDASSGSTSVQRVDLADSRSLATGAMVAVFGRITAPPGVLGNGVAYIGDERAGVRIYASTDVAMPELREGDVVEVVGVTEDYHGEREIVVAAPSGIRLVEHGRPIAPLPIDTAQVGEEVEGRLVAVAGAVSRLQGNSIWLDDGSGEARALWKQTTGMAMPAFEPGQQITVIGITSQYARAMPWHGGYRIQPRYPADCVRALSSGLEATPQATLASSSPVGPLGPPADPTEHASAAPRWNAAHIRSAAYF